MSVKQFSNDFQVMNLNRHNMCITNIDGIPDSEDNVILVVPYAMPEGCKGIRLEDVILVSDTGTASSASDTKYSFQIKNLTQSEDLLATAVDTYATAEITADTAYRITPDQNNTELSPGDVLELQITKAGSPTDLTSAKVKVEAVWSWEV